MENPLVTNAAADTQWTTYNITTVAAGVTVTSGITTNGNSCSIPITGLSPALNYVFRVIAKRTGGSHGEVDSLPSATTVPIQTNWPTALCQGDTFDVWDNVGNSALVSVNILYPSYATEYDVSYQETGFYSVDANGNHTVWNPMVSGWSTVKIPAPALGVSPLPQFTITGLQQYTCYNWEIRSTNPGNLPSVEYLYAGNGIQGIEQM
jgi:hypothetical protein